MPVPSTRSLAEAIAAGDVVLVEEILRENPRLAAHDCRAPDQQDEFTHGFPLVQAATTGSAEIVARLLQAGADVNATSTNENDPPEFGMPLHHAVVRGDCALAHLLLDHGASVHGFPYCDQPTIERLYAAAQDAGAPSALAWQGVSQYFPTGFDDDRDACTIADDAPSEVKLLDRFLELGAELNMSSIIRGGRWEVVEALLRSCPTAPAPRNDYPPGTVFQVIVGTSAWHGYPDVIDLCLELWPELFDADCARGAIQSAVISHNRDGTWQEYHRLIATLLDHVEQIGELDALREDHDFQPLFMLAEHYCWHENYGYRAGISTPEGMLKIAELFLARNIGDANYRDPLTNQTSVGMAGNRKGHPCMKEYVEFLLEHGAEPE